jgi:DNA-binding CsgD family transcriptional regulator
MSQLYKHQFENQYYKDEQEGQQLLQKALGECHQGLALYEEPMFRYKDGLYCNLSKIHFQQGQYDSCIYYAEKQLDFMSTMRFEIVPNPENADIFQRLYKSYEALGNKEKSLEYADRYFEMLQTIESQPKAVEQVKSEFDKKLALMQLQHEQQVKRYRLYLILALVLLSLTVVLWLGNRYRKNKEIEALRHEEAYRKLESEFEAVSRQSLQALQQRVMELYKTSGNDKLKRVMAEFEASYPLAKEKIKTNCPDLTESECNIVILSFLGFRTKEEAEILHLSLNTVEKYRTNIRKKAGSDAISQLIG